MDKIPFGKFKNLMEKSLLVSTQYFSSYGCISLRQNDTTRHPYNFGPKRNPKRLQHENWGHLKYYFELFLIKGQIDQGEHFKTKAGSIEPYPKGEFKLEYDS